MNRRPKRPNPRRNRPVTRKRNDDLSPITQSSLLAKAERVASFGVWEHHVDTRKVEVSKQLASLLGMRRGAKLTAERYWNQVHPEDAARLRPEIGRAVAAGEPFQFVCRYRMRNGTIKNLSAIGFTLTNKSGRPERTIGVVQDISDQTRAAEDLRRVTQQLIRARDEERRDMARELHESAGQTLAALKMTLGRLSDAIAEDDEQARSLLSAALGFTEDAVREVRTVSYVMHPPLLDEAGLASALRWYAKGFGERSGIVMDIEVPDQFARMSQEVETTLFRIVQEALTNVHRYSGSRTATIRLRRIDDKVTAEVQDNGCGLPLPSGIRGKGEPLGVGIAGMRERVNRLNGTFEIESVPGRGTTVRATLPLAVAEGSFR